MVGLGCIGLRCIRLVGLVGLGCIGLVGWLVGPLHHHVYYVELETSIIYEWLLQLDDSKYHHDHPFHTGCFFCSKNPSQIFVDFFHDLSPRGNLQTSWEIQQNIGP